MKTYAFKVVFEKDKWPDEPDEKAVWRAYIPTLEEQGAATWGYTKEEALKNIQEVAQKDGEIGRLEEWKDGSKQPSILPAFHSSWTLDKFGKPRTVFLPAPICQTRKC